MIEVKHIIKSFEGRTVLKDISALFEEGKTNLIIGRSGSGKTVMIKNIIGLMRPDSGQILYDGRNLLTMNKRELNHLRREMGMLFQGSALFDSMTVLENVMTALDPVTFFGFSGDTVIRVTDSFKLMADGAVIVKETDTDYYSSRYVMDYPVASFAVEARYDITDDWRISYRQGVEAWKSNPMRNGSNVRNVSRLETEFKMPFCRDLSVALGMADIFDQAFEVVPGQKARGFTGYLSVTYVW